MHSTVSIIIPTLNEESTISGLLSHLLKVGASQIVVVDGNSPDRTAELASRSGVSVIRMPPCRALQMNTGAKASTGEVLLFLHADVRIAPGALPAIQDAMRDPRVAGGNLDIRYQGRDLAASCFTFVNRQRRRLGIFYGDSGIFCRRSVFEELGGFRPWPVLEDYDLARRLRRFGRLALLQEAIQVSDRRWRRSGLICTMWSWLIVQGLYCLGVSPHRLARLYRDVR